MSSSVKVQFVAVCNGEKDLCNSYREFIGHQSCARQWIFLPVVKKSKIPIVMRRESAHREGRVICLTGHWRDSFAKKKEKKIGQGHYSRFDRDEWHTESCQMTWGRQVRDYSVTWRVIYRVANQAAMFTLDGLSNRWQCQNDRLFFKIGKGRRGSMRHRRRRPWRISAWEQECAFIVELNTAAV